MRVEIDFVTQYVAADTDQAQQCMLLNSFSNIWSIFSLR